MIPGVALTLLYENRYVPPIAILPITTTGDSPDVGARVQAILARDLDYSDRFVIVDSLPAVFSDAGVEYGFWDQYGVDWLLTGRVERVAGARFLSVELHDIVTADLRARTRVPLPPPEDPEFRMAVHRISDEVVAWVTGEQGMAASRIVFRMRPFGGSMNKELYIVDSDGANLRRITWDDSVTMSAAWSPDGTRIMYTSFKAGPPGLYELDLARNAERAIEVGREGQPITPTYHPHGSEIAFTLIGGGTRGLFSYDIRNDCCLRLLAGGLSQNLQPSYSHDGRSLVFVSSRLEGVHSPQIFTMPSEGGRPEILSPFRYGQRGYFTDPDWSPLADQVAFAGRIQGRGTYARYHIFIADLDEGDRRLTQLTREGNNEDPSWAPDGRHIVFIGERSNGTGVFVVDAVTGRTRVLVANVDAEDTDWSPSLGGGGAVRSTRGGGVR
ncbi:MAG: hypothetical protein F4059_08805 [Gemmatimonadetes bacterium]|nr:hypothetical protein [Gemmatimonadota bacterium]